MIQAQDGAVLQNTIYSIICAVELILDTAAYVLWGRKYKHKSRKMKVATHLYFSSRIVSLLVAIFSFTLVTILMPTISDDGRPDGLRWLWVFVIDSVYEIAFLLFGKVGPTLTVIYSVGISIGILVFSSYISRFLTIVKWTLASAFITIAVVLSTINFTISYQDSTYYPELLVFPVEAFVIVIGIIVIAVYLIMLIWKDKYQGHLLYQEYRIYHKKLLYLSLGFLSALTFAMVTDIISYIMGRLSIAVQYKQISTSIGYVMFMVCFIMAQFPPQQIFQTYIEYEEILTLGDEYFDM